MNLSETNASARAAKARDRFELSNLHYTDDLPSKASQLRAYYRALYRSWGRQNWWPGRTRFEVIVGAYLVQSTAWGNVRRALRSLRSAGVLNPRGIRDIRPVRLESMIRPAGYFRQKAHSLKTFVAFLDDRYQGSLTRMFSQPIQQLRHELLSLRGVGPETADSILLYAGQHPVFVVDAYTRRILDRHQILPATAGYEEIRNLVERALAPLASKPHPQPSKAAVDPPHKPSPMSRAQRPPLAQVYNEMHGLMVAVGKSYCLKSEPLCDRCPLQQYLPQHRGL
jgi:endonuclease-3 related protein